MITGPVVFEEWQPRTDGTGLAIVSFVRDGKPEKQGYIVSATGALDEVAAKIKAENRAESSAKEAGAKLSKGMVIDITPDPVE